MKSLRLAALLPLALVACGGNTASDFQDATPSYAALSVDMTGTATTGGQMMTAQAAAVVDPGALDACHPHLFLRTHGLALRANRHLWKFLRHVEGFGMRRADRQSAGQASWHDAQIGLETRWTVTKVSDAVFDWKLELKSPAVSDWTTVLFGHVDRTSATTRHQGTGNATLDLDALHLVLPEEPVAGKVEWTFESLSDHRKVVVRATGVVWDGRGDLDAAALGATPRNALYVYYREPGKGGSFKASDQMVFVCPATIPPNTLPADVQVVSRWFRLADGAVHGRSDARMVGGQLPATDEILGVVCHAGAAEGAMQAENYWMMKEEDAQNATVQSWGPVGSATSCDALFGPVPAVDGGASDFDFTAIDFASTDPVPVPHP